MEIICPGCHTKYNISDDKLPDSDIVILRCPKCNQKIKLLRDKINKLKQEKVSIKNENKEISNSQNTPKYTEKLDIYDEELSKGMEFFSSDTKTALFFASQAHAVQEISSRLQQLGFEVRKIRDVEELKARFRYHTYDLILICKLNENDNLIVDKLLTYINKMPMQVRRNIIVIYCHLTGNKLDTMQAFLYGVDITISPLDLTRLEEVIEKTEKNKKVLYRVFKECKDIVEKQIS